MEIFSKFAELIDPERNQRDWDEQIPFAFLSYLSAVHRSTGETPNMMVLGREVELPLDLMMEPVPRGEEQMNLEFCFSSYLCQLWLIHD